MFRKIRYLDLAKILSVSAFNLFGISYNSYFQIKLQTKQTTKEQDYIYYQKTSESAQLTFKLKSRQQHLDEIKQKDYDVIIIGGGAIGSGIALECAQRGLNAVLFESEDFASGASSKSSKLVHGGARYLQQIMELSMSGGRMEKFRLLVESIRERSTFLSISQNFTKEIQILLPCSSLFKALYFYSGTLLYHIIYKIYAQSGRFQFHAPRIICRKEMKEQFPNSQYNWGILFSDGQFNDGRMVQELLLTSTLDNYHESQKNPTNIMNYAEVTQLLKDKSGRINGIVVKDKIQNLEYKVKGSIVVNATGCFADEIRLMDNPKVLKRIVPAGGSHIVLPLKYNPSKWGYIIQSTNDGRFIMLLPWMQKTLVGATQKVLQNPIRNPQVSAEEQSWLVKQISNSFQLPVEEINKDIQSKWSGLTCLVHKKGLKEGEIFDIKNYENKHVLEVSQSGLISIMGGKWTIYRQMGQDTVDLIYNEIQTVKSVQRKPSVSSSVKLLGEFDKSKQQTIQNRKLHIIREASLLQEKFKMSYTDAKYFIVQYGERAFDIWKLTSQNSQYRSKIHPDFPHTIGEIIYLIRYELALKPQDILFRRTQLGQLDSQAIFQFHTQIVEIFANELKWDRAKKNQVLQDNLNEIKQLNY